MTSIIPEQDKEKALTAFRNFNFEWVATLHDMYSKLEYDVPEINLEIKEKFSEKLSLLMTAGRNKKSTLVLPIVGSAGSGKTHLLNFFYSQAIEKKGFFCAREFYQTERLLEDIITALCESMTGAEQHGKNQLPELLKNVIIESDVTLELQHSSQEVFLKNLSCSERNKLIKDVADGLFQKYRSEIPIYFDILKAVFFLASGNSVEATKATAWLQSNDVKELEPGELKFNKSNENAYNILKGLTWLMTLNDGFCVIVIDQMDSAHISPKDSDKDNKQENYKDLGLILSKLATDTFKTLPVLSTHSEAWNSLIYSTLKSYVDRFFDPITLSPVSKPEYLEKIIELRMSQAYREAGFNPPYPAWPFPTHYFEQYSGFTPREILRNCYNYIEVCISKKNPIEWSKGEIKPKTLVDNGVRSETKLFNETIDNFNVNEIKQEIKEKEFWEDALPVFRDALVIDAELENRKISTNFKPDLPNLTLRLESPSTSKSATLWVVPDHKVSDAVTNLKHVLQAVKKLEDVKINRIVITRDKKIDHFKRIAPIVNSLKDENAPIIYPTKSDIKGLKALIEVKKHFPNTWEEWLRDFNPIKKIQYLSSIIDWLHLGSEVSGFEISIAELLSPNKEKIPIPDGELRRHVGVFGATGSGKTVLLRRIIEEVAINKVPCIIIDISGDLANLGQQWKKKPELWDAADEVKAKLYFDNAEVIIWTPDKDDANPFNLPLFEEVSNLDQNDFDRAKTYNIQIINGLTKQNLKDGDEAALSRAMDNIARDKAKFDISNLKRELEIIMMDEDDPESTESLRHGAEKTLDVIKLANIKGKFKYLNNTNDISELINSGSNKTRVSVITLAHIHDHGRRQNIVASLLNSFYTYIKENHKKFLNAMLFIDEAHNFAPAIKNAISTEIISRIANEARKYGFGLVVASQK
ncbi:MAG: ATP-binding protein, partial [Endomicrobium sp.]|nr:ATP-binding protein [Endomicrobium sp.]